MIDLYLSAAVTRFVTALAVSRFLRPRTAALVVIDDAADEAYVAPLFKLLPHRTPRRVVVVDAATAATAMPGAYDVVASLNVSDRSLRNVAKTLTPDGVLLTVRHPGSEAWVPRLVGRDFVVRARVGLVAPEGKLFLGSLPPNDARTVRSLRSAFGDDDLGSALAVAAFPEAAALTLYALGRATDSDETTSEKAASSGPPPRRSATTAQRRTSRDYILRRLADDGYTSTKPPREWADRVAAEVIERFSTPGRTRTTKASDVYFVYAKAKGIA